MNCPRCGERCDELLLCAECSEDLCARCLPGGVGTVCVQCEEAAEE